MSQRILMIVLALSAFLATASAAGRLGEKFANNQKKVELESDHNEGSKLTRSYDSCPEDPCELEMEEQIMGDNTAIEINTFDSNSDKFEVTCVDDTKLFAVFYFGGDVLANLAEAQPTCTKWHVKFKVNGGGEQCPDKDYQSFFGFTTDDEVCDIRHKCGDKTKCKEFKDKFTDAETTIWASMRFDECVCTGPTINVRAKVECCAWSS